MMNLKRRQASGFVKYPKTFPKRIVDGSARYRTKCDVLVGPCACGGTHQETDDWVRELLRAHDAVIDTLALAPDEAGRIAIPKYWSCIRHHEICDTLVGQCCCGLIHNAKELWVHLALRVHGAKVLGVEAIED
jgi:hypothetical protein